MNSPHGPVYLSLYVLALCFFATVQVFCVKKVLDVVVDCSDPGVDVYYIKPSWYFCITAAI